jgi:MEMO1 family protein
MRTAALRGRAQAIERVVLVGPFHYLPSPCAALPLRRSMTSKPRGQTPVDAAALAKVADLPFVVRSDAPHAPELEVELPFLQMLLASFRIVPLVVGDAAAQSVAEVLRILWGGPETLIVVSSD